MLETFPARWPAIMPVRPGAARNLSDLMRPGRACRPRAGPRPRRLRSAAGRFWLIFRLPSSRVIVSSNPMMPFSMPCTKSAGASETAQGAARAPSWRSVRRVTMSSSSRPVVDEPQRAVGVDGGVVPGRHDFAGLALGRVVRWCDVAVGALEDRQRLADRSRACGLGRARWPISVPYGAGSGSSSSGTWLAIIPSARHRDQRGEAAGADRVMQDGDAIFGEMGGDVHGADPDS